MSSMNAADAGRVAGTGTYLAEDVGRLLGCSIRHVRRLHDARRLWRLLVAWSEAELVAGPDSPTARALAREINRRLTGPTSADPSPREGGKEGRHG